MIPNQTKRTLTMTQTETDQEQQIKIEAVRAALTLDKFREWIANHPHPENIGTIQSCGTCPLAMYLIETCHVPQIGVAPWGILEEASNIYIYYFGTKRQFLYCDIPPMPDWAKKFIKEVDKLQSSVVHAVDALMILDEIKAQLAGENKIIN